MALKTGDKSDKPDNGKVADCFEQESTKKVTAVRKKYASKRAEFQVRKRTIQKEKEGASEISSNCEINTRFNLLSQSVPSTTMFYPPHAQYYPISTNEWSPVISIQCPLYSLQPIPVIVPPLTQICPLPIIVPPVTVANEFPVSHLVSVNEFSLQIDESPTSMPNEVSTVYCESPIIASLSNGFSKLAVYNEVATPVNSFTSFATLSNEVASVITMPNEYSPLFSFASCEISPIGTPMSDIFSPIQTIQVPNEFIPICASDEISPVSSCNYESFSCEYFECDLPIVDEGVHESKAQEYEHYVENSLEFYLSLPKDLFPTAWMMTIDPNSIIDEFCKVPNLDDHGWILDLEFGVPKTPVTRRVATYNVKLNSIHCKNVPEAIHPGFEGCDKDLKRALMFYYDCVISNWYTGYITLSCDRSVENFQSWLLLPMQVLGMCWA